MSNTQQYGIVRSSGALDSGLTMEAAAARPDYTPSADPMSDYQRERRAKMRQVSYFFGGAVVLGMAVAIVKNATAG